MTPLHLGVPLPVKHHVAPGNIYRPIGQTKNKELVLVYRISKDGTVFYDGLSDKGNNGAICHGPGSSAHFLTMYEYVSTMRFEGAYKKYRQEREKVRELRWWMNHIADFAKRGQTYRGYKGRVA
jgi:hypothetical protein